MSEDNNLQAQQAVLHMTIGITRKATGITETFELVGDPIPLEEAQKIATEQPKEAP